MGAISNSRPNHPNPPLETRLFFLPGGLLHKQGPRRSRIRGDLLPHSHSTLAATSCFVFPSAGGPSEGPGEPDCVFFFKRLAGGLEGMAVN
jgi:hypothetical protein